jgi:hypothetical protein
MLDATEVVVTTGRMSGSGAEEEAHLGKSGWTVVCGVGREARREVREGLQDGWREVVVVGSDPDPFPLGCGGFGLGDVGLGDAGFGAAGSGSAGSAGTGPGDEEPSDDESPPDEPPDEPPFLASRASRFGGGGYRCPPGQVAGSAGVGSAISCRVLTGTGSAETEATAARRATNEKLVRIMGGVTKRRM